MTSALLKVEGAGNDFVLGVGSWGRRLDEDLELVRRVCDRRRGVGADGVLIVGRVSDEMVRLVYRNSDGSKARFCANGTRCAARVAVEVLGCSSSLVVATDWCEIPARVEGRQVRLELPAPPAPPQGVDLPVSPPLRDVRVLEIGVPHLVVEHATDLDALDLPAVAPPLRRHPALGPAGANVNFFEVTGDGEVTVRSWERGVEAETLSCGSGLVAVALVVMGRDGREEVRLRPASGDLITVAALGEPPSCASRLSGPTRLVAEIVPGDELLTDR